MYAPGDRLRLRAELIEDGTVKWTKVRGGLMPPGCVCLVAGWGRADCPYEARGVLNDAEMSALLTAIGLPWAPEETVPWWNDLWYRRRRGVIKALRKAADILDKATEAA